jgi:alpha-beta hydrolase superfamily lysophospholipase
MLAHARYLLRGGFTVLMHDSRGHGVSGGDIVTYGVREAGDVDAWADFALHVCGIDRLYGSRR